MRGTEQSACWRGLADMEFLVQVERLRRGIVLDDKEWAAFEVLGGLH